jgi:hypothetical protein
MGLTVSNSDKNESNKEFGQPGFSSIGIKDTHYLEIHESPLH